MYRLKRTLHEWKESIICIYLCTLYTVQIVCTWMKRKYNMHRYLWTLYKFHVHEWKESIICMDIYVKDKCQIEAYMKKKKLNVRTDIVCTGWMLHEWKKNCTDIVCTDWMVH